MDPIQSDTSSTNTEITNPTTPVIPDSVQTRFNELTAQNSETARQLAQQNQMVQELMAQNAALALRLSQPAPVNTTPPEGVDVTTANYMAEAIAKQNAAEFKKLRDEMAAMVGGVRAQQVQTEMQQATAGVAPEVAKEANRLMGEWQRAGLTGWAPKDAVIYAAGAMALKNANVQRANAPNGDGTDAVTQAGGRAPNPVTQNRTLPPAKSDAEVAKMTPLQQEAYWGSRVGDSEIQY